MIKSILIAGIFFVVIFLLFPDNKELNSLGIKIIALYLVIGIIYFPIMIFWLLRKVHKTPLESIDSFIYEKLFKKWFSKKQ